jgi:hypothetical protein
MRFSSPQTKIRSLSMTSSSGCSGFTFMRPITPPNGVRISVMMIGRCQWISRSTDIVLKSESRRKWCASNTNDGRPEGSTMTTHFFPEAFNCRGNGSLGERSNFGNKGRSLSMGRQMTLRGSINSPSFATRISSRSRKFNAPTASNCPTSAPAAPTCFVINARKSRSRKKVIPSSPSHQLSMIAVGFATGKSASRYTFSSGPRRAAMRSAFREK